MHSTICSDSGFQTAFTIKNIEDETIPLIEHNVRKIPSKIDNAFERRGIQATSVERHQINELIFGSFATNPNEFEFSSEERKIIRSFVELSERLSMHDDYSIFLQQKTNTTTTKTPVGTIFSNPPKDINSLRGDNDVNHEFNCNYYVWLRKLN